MRIPSFTLVLVLLVIGSRYFVVSSAAQGIDLRTIIPDNEINYDGFGYSMASLGDLDGDGVADLAVGAPSDRDGGLIKGAVWVLFMQSDGRVKGRQKINQTEGGFTGVLDKHDSFGWAVASPGDLDGDGVVDLVVGAPGGNDDDGGFERGAVWILFMQPDGRVKGHQKISKREGGFTGSINDLDWFGSSVTSPGDLDGDGIADLAVGARDTGVTNERGAVWVLFMQSDGRVKGHQKISQTEGGFTGILDEYDQFGSSVTSPGDLDGDGVTDLAVGTKSAVWVLFMQSDGRVKGHQKIGEMEGGFTRRLDGGDPFGFSIISPGDLDGDGVVDLVVGASGDNDGGPSRGALWVLFLQSDGQVKGHQKISQLEGSFTGLLEDNDRFGDSVTSLGDLDGDGVTDLAVGAKGTVWVLFMQADGHVKRHQKYNHSESGFTGILDNGERFGSSITSLGDLDGDGVEELVVGVPDDDDGGPGRGAIWVLFMGSDGRVKGHQKISQTEGDFAGSLDDYDWFGSSITSPGDLDGDGVADLVVGASGDDDGLTSSRYNGGAVWVLFMQSDGRVKGYQKISQSVGGFTGIFDEYDQLFGSSVTSISDLDGDGVTDLAVGARGNDLYKGAVWVLFMQSDGRVKKHQKIGETIGGFTRTLDGGDGFGFSITSPGDLDGDGVADLAVGAPGDGITDDGAVWVLFMQSDGRVKGYQKISQTEGGFTGVLDSEDLFGSSVTTLGDLDGDGVADLAVGAPTEGGFNRSGDVWVLFLRLDGRVKEHQKISQTEVGVVGTLGDSDYFGQAVALLSDLDGDGAAELVVGVPGDDDGGTDMGAVWVLFLNGPPQITWNNSFYETPVIAGDDLLLRSEIYDKQGILNAQVHFKRGSDSSQRFLANSLEPSGDGTFEGFIPAVAVTDRGVEFYFTAEDILNQVSRQPSMGVFEIRVDVPDMRMTDPFAIDLYRLFSIPLDVAEKSPERILNDDLGFYDPTVWRFFEPAPGLAPDAFLEYPEIDSIVPGKAFWLITEGTNITISTGPGQSNSTTSPFAILVEPGWNYVGTPYTFSVPLVNLTLQSGNPLDIRTYGDSGWRSLSEIESIEPFEGYIVANSAETVDTLFIKAEAQDEPASPGKRVDQDEALWAIHLSAQAGTARHEETIATVSATSAAGLDLLDRPASPRPMGDYVSVYFPHSDWQQHFKHYSVDVRPPREDGEVWDFEITTSVRDVATLTFEEIDTVPREFEVWLVDEAVNLSQNLREVNTYTIAGPLERYPKQLRLVVGKSDFAETQGVGMAEVPQEYSLSQNFPNPFSAATTIPYALPKDERVTLTIYSILGERIATLLPGEEKPAGYHAAIWNGRNDAGQSVASGLYFITLQAGAYTETRKAILVK